MGEHPKTQRDKFVEEIAKTPFVEGLTTSIFANEFGARVLLKILMDKGIVTNEEWVAGCLEMNKVFVDLHTQEYSIASRSKSMSPVYCSASMTPKLPRSG